MLFVLSGFAVNSRAYSRITMSVAKLLTSIIMLIIFCLALIVSASCLDSRIIGGTNTTIDKLPYQVSIHKNGNFHCGGSIIHQQWILTAAHCVNKGSTSDFTVRVGSTYHDKEGLLITGIAKICSNEKFDSNTYDYDVGLIKLSTFLTFGPNVKSIDLVLPSDSVPRTEATVAGWGETALNSENSKVLHCVTVPIVDPESCQKSYTDFNMNVTSNMLCAGNGEKDACKGDSGGALVTLVDKGKVQIGIVSYGAKCGIGLTIPGLYTRVSAMRQWITEKMREERDDKECKTKKGSNTNRPMNEKQN
ncbi:trypsin-1 [Solenopsis invicta]|uniref:trypsin-1 n=1 Tax=Solenopsis invicta TaxID=13686 RepID=UPI00193D893F|nr:trypsin-1 [Solenopsis invicta]